MAISDVSLACIITCDQALLATYILLGWCKKVKQWLCLSRSVMISDKYFPTPAPSSKSSSFRASRRTPEPPPATPNTEDVKA